jgi:protease-4
MKKLLVVLIVVIVLLGGGLAGLYLLLKGVAGGKAVSVGKDSYLVLELSGMLTEERPTDLLGGALHSGRITVKDILVGLRRAANDDRIKALVVRLGPAGVGWGKAEEVRRTVRRFAEGGKPVVAYMEAVTDREYYVASAAPTVCALPSGLLLVDGLAAQALFMRGTLDKLGIEPELVQVGRYKGAGEAFTRKTMSEPLRESLEAVLDDRYKDLVDAVAASRSLTAAGARDLLDEGPYTARAAVGAGLVDTLMYYEEIKDLLAERIGAEDLEEVSLRDYLKASSSDIPSGAPRVGLVYAVGQIASGKSQSSPFGGNTLGSETLIKALRDARESKRIKAIVLRIDSPGGSGLASDAIWREIRRCVEEKPVVASMSDVAASGGYFIAAAASAIVAEPGTITGSIGVIGGKFNMSGLYSKLGLHKEELARGKRALMFSENRGFSPEERRKFQSMMATFYYEAFLPKVSEGRGMTAEEVDSVGQGRIWTGRQARELGLVDELGGLREAIELAKKEAGLPAEQEVRLVQYPREKKFFEVLMEKVDMAAVLPVLAELRLEWPWEAGEPLTLLPYEIEVE